MAGATTPDNLFFPTVGDVATPRAEMTMLADTVQAAFMKRQVYTFRWNTTLDMNAQTGMRFGDLGYNAQTNMTMIYNTNSQWGKLGGEDVPGTYLLRPSSVNGGTIAADGSIVPTGTATSISVNGCFSSRFRKYRVEYFFNLASSANILLRLRNAGVDNSTTQYISVSLEGQTATPTVYTATLDGIPTSNVANNSHWGHYEFTNVGQGGTGLMKTMETHTASGRGGTPSIAIRQARLEPPAIDLTTFDGFTAYVSSAVNFSSTSWMKIYGLA